MNAVVEYRSRDAVIHPYVSYEDCGDIVEEILKRLGKVEIDVSELKLDVRGILTQIPHLATKDDLTPLKLDIAGVKTSIAELRTELKGDNAGVRMELKDEIHRFRAELKGEIGELKGEIGELKAGLASMEGKLIKWFVATALASVGAAFSLAKLVH